VFGKKCGWAGGPPFQGLSIYLARVLISNLDREGISESEVCEGGGMEACG
jgi:hypothetical protein